MIDGQSVGKIKLAFRAAVNMVERSRMGRAALAGMRPVRALSGRVLHKLWLEVTGFTFLAMAAVGPWPFPRIWQVPVGHARDRGGCAGDLFYSFVHCSDKPRSGA